MTITKTDKLEFVCHVRRHLTPSEFRTYDTMRIMVMSGPHEKGDQLFFHGRLAKLANYTNSSIRLEEINIKSLEAKGWLVRSHQQRWRGGKFGTVEYLLLSHDEYVACEKFPHGRAHKWSPCPPYKYDMETGELITPGKLKPGLAKVSDDKKRNQLIRAFFSEGLYPKGEPKK
jgi:hypothetical protein